MTYILFFTKKIQLISNFSGGDWVRFLVVQSSSRATGSQPPLFSLSQFAPPIYLHSRVFNNLPPLLFSSLPLSQILSAQFYHTPYLGFFLSESIGQWDSRRSRSPTPSLRWTVSQLLSLHFDFNFFVRWSDLSISAVSSFLLGQICS